MGAALQDLHLALGHAEQACAVAAARAQQEQAAGNYKASWGVGMPCWAGQAGCDLGGATTWEHACRATACRRTRSAIHEHAGALGCSF